MRRIPCKLWLFLITMSAAWVGSAQAQDLLGQINALRTARGLAPYTIDGALSAAAQNQAAWMAQTGQVSHTQSDGSTPRSRAAAAGYSSTWVSENIYLGRSAEAAWTFWLNSPVHYAGLTNPNYEHVGIASASGPHGTAYVLVFGARTAPNFSSAGGSTAGSDSTSRRPAPTPRRSLVVGIAADGSLMHEIQPGETIGDIALMYGYGWGDIPAMLALNGLTQDDIRRILPGQVFLVPPRGGTFTPTPSPTIDPALLPTATSTPSATATPTPTETLEPLPEPALFNSAQTPTPLPSPTPEPAQALPTRALVVRALPTQIAALTTPASFVPTAPVGPEGEDGPPAWLWAIIGAQLAILGGATLELLRRRRR
ncbi:MAG: CAP domain-containing protein [Anaerolineae bacterium]|nr:CAP domain-containing protein [Anaerolineae bacterium]MDW8172316.1 CAP domain-containing protein [Anaerolineae bacterium]